MEIANRYRDEKFVCNVLLRNQKIKNHTKARTKYNKNSTSFLLHFCYVQRLRFVTLFSFLLHSLSISLSQIPIWSTSLLGFLAARFFAYLHKKSPSRHVSFITQIFRSTSVLLHDVSNDRTMKALKTFKFKFKWTYLFTMTEFR